MHAAPSAPRLDGRMFVGMTRPQTRTYGVVTPSTRQPLLEAMLRAFVWLVSNAVSMLATIFNRHTRDWHTDDANENQFPTPSGITQETHQAAPTGLSNGSGLQPALPAKAWVRNGAEGAIWSGGPNRVTEAASYARGLQTPHEVRTPTLALSPLIPTKVGIQGRTRSLSRLAASTPHTHHTAPGSRASSRACRRTSE